MYIYDGAQSNYTNYFSLAIGYFIIQMSISQAFPDILEVTDVEEQWNKYIGGVEKAIDDTISKITDFTTVISLKNSAILFYISMQRIGFGTNITILQTLFKNADSFIKKIVDKLDIDTQKYLNNENFTQIKISTAKEFEKYARSFGSKEIQNKGVYPFYLPITMSAYNISELIDSVSKYLCTDENDIQIAYDGIDAAFAMVKVAYTKYLNVSTALSMHQNALMANNIKFFEKTLPYYESVVNNIMKGCTVEYTAKVQYGLITLSTEYEELAIKDIEAKLRKNLVFYEGINWVTPTIEDAPHYFIKDMMEWAKTNIAWLSEIKADLVPKSWKKCAACYNEYIIETLCNHPMVSRISLSCFYNIFKDLDYILSVASPLPNYAEFGKELLPLIDMRKLICENDIQLLGSKEGYKEKFPSLPLVTIVQILSKYKEVKPSLSSILLLKKAYIIDNVKKAKALLKIK